MKKLEFHPIADAFPLIEGDEKKELFADVAKNGIHEQGVLLDGMILDGRNRYLAAKSAGVEMPFRKFDKSIDGESPFAFVVSMNIRRRHMTTSQRAMVATKLANLSGKGRPKENASNEAISQDDAAKSMNVSRSAVQRAEKVVENSPAAVVKAVESGEVKVSDAASVADESKRVQNAALKAVQDGAAKTMRQAVKELEQPRKSGKQTFDARPFVRLDSYLGKALRMVDALNKTNPAPKFHRDALAAIKSAMREVADWQRAVK